MIMLSGKISWCNRHCAFDDVGYGPRVFIRLRLCSCIEDKKHGCSSAKIQNTHFVNK